MKKVNWESRDLERAGKNINDMVSGIEYRRIEMSFRHPDGKRRTVFISPHPIDNIDGSVVSIEGIVEDITDRKRVEEEREKLINELQAALNEIKTLRGILPLCSFCKKFEMIKAIGNRLMFTFTNIHQPILVIVSALTVHRNIILIWIFMTIESYRYLFTTTFYHKPLTPD